MGLIGRLLSFNQLTRGGAYVSDVKLDPGGGANLTGEHFGPAGDDSHPLAGDYVQAVRVTQSGRVSVLGYLDPENAPKAEAGEKRIYSRDTDGIPAAELWLKNDGSILLTNPAGGVIQLQADGVIVLNGVTIDLTGSISAPSIVANGKELAGHDHLAGIPPGNTGPNN